MFPSVPLLLALSGALAVSALPRAVSNTTTSCPVLLDGRVPSNATLDEFDATNGIFNPDYVKGNNVSWSDILLFPSAVPASRFDSGSYKPLEVTINNASIFQTQYGFRRAGLQFAADTNTGSPGYAGVVTLHWSVRQDPARALNLSHEYLNVWHESADYSADQIMFQAGQMIDFPDLPSDTFKIFDRNSALLWSTEIEEDEWQNFAVTLDMDANTVQFYYSVGTDALAAVTNIISADLSGDGEYQIGILKKPTGSSDVVNSGYQEAPFEEGQIYGGLFVEDSTGGCISL
ncbi:hypothetical protein M406DRAFT_323640 [Cryphonectria parasitica EP155]|uniref:Glycoside hydrolase 131 catalytic N-terminal domain-containing protein n=1 Tax=Cryphonectria parasitica (strain ATCC 38755 / EP155) TaxID=660469 RepID=A0A9P4XXB4_CRYP1|nr:uncharacterized protein M406DRAFT_323640 [Cryphonectria parasitica EP155]KAF3762644.1 hypothetical protein M406DRAFT_323640 [Cryphonectria parasitica EP155]